MEISSSLSGGLGSAPERSYSLPIVQGIEPPDSDVETITEDLIHAIVVEFYARVGRDDRLGPMFEVHVHNWPLHLDRMTDFWSTVLLRTGRYTGRPPERHRSIAGLSDKHFDRWLELFEATVQSLCTPQQAAAFLDRAHRMRDALVKVLGL